MFAYAPNHAQEVAKAIEQQGGKAYIIRVDEGTREEQVDMNLLPTLSAVRDPDSGWE